MSVRPKSLALVLAVLLGALIAALPARAQGLIRDAEIERTLAGIANPIYRAAGLSPSRVSLYLVNDRRLNAFVAGGSNIFMNTGLLQRLESVDEVRAVLAHETGHIAGGHLARRDEQIRRARGTLALGVLASIAAAAAGNPEAAFTAGALGNQVATRNLLAHSRAEESGADQAALAYMVAAGSDPRAIIKVFDLFRGQEILSAGQTDPYIRTHPLWSQRLRDLEAKVDRAPRGRGTDTGLAYWHQRMVAKLDAFLDTPQRTLRDYGNDRSEIGAMARAIAYHRLPDRRRALQAINALLAARPEDAYYQELAGQFRLENGDAAGAVDAYRRAARLAPKEPLILAGLGRALVAMETGPATREALEVLTQARRLDRGDPRALRSLALAYARTGQEGQASLATAERLMLLGRLGDAAIHARRAQAALPRGGPGWRQADDILRAAERGK